MPSPSVKRKRAHASSPASRPRKAARNAARMHSKRPRASSPAAVDADDAHADASRPRKAARKNPVGLFYARRIERGARRGKAGPLIIRRRLLAAGRWPLRRRRRRRARQPPLPAMRAGVEPPTRQPGVARALLAAEVTPPTEAPGVLAPLLKEYVSAMCCGTPPIDEAALHERYGPLTPLAVAALAGAGQTTMNHRSLAGNPRPVGPAVGKAGEKVDRALFGRLIKGTGCTVVPP
jgi:hypothetical protein